MSAANSNNVLVFERNINLVPKNLVPDADGYYWVNAGAYNVFNSAGEYYDGSTIDDLLSNTSSLQRRFDKGVVFNELDHPVRPPNISDAAWDARMSTVSSDRICGHTRAAKLRMNADNKVKLIRINIAPHGVYAKSLQDGFDSTFANQYLSVRSTSNRTRVNGILIKKVSSITTWDAVVEGGIDHANKFDTESYEKLSASDIAKVSKTEIITSLDLCDTAEVSYVMKHLKEYQNTYGVYDTESGPNELIKILNRARNTDNENTIFNWK